MRLAEITVEERLPQFVGEYADNQCCLLELLRFLGSHPSTRFSQLAIVHALDRRRVYIERALKYLVNKGVLRAHAENGALLYSLTEDEALRRPVLMLANLDWCRWHLMLKEVYSAFLK